MPFSPYIILLTIIVKNETNIFSGALLTSKRLLIAFQDILFQKLLNHSINGKFYDCLTKIYTNDLACVKIGNTLTKTFTVNQGVKQGCILCPTLFNIFLSDLQNTTEQAKCDPVQIAENSTLGCLIWADDLLLLSQSENGLKKYDLRVKIIHRKKWHETEYEENKSDDFQ